MYTCQNKDFLLSFLSSAQWPTIFIAGVIYINRRLDYETMPNKRISFQVVVYSDDTGSDRRSAIATVIVEVTDTNDHSPQFDEDVRTVGKQIIYFIFF